MRDDRLPGYRGDLNASSLTIAEVLRSAGYSTYMSGKWHVTSQMGYWLGDSSKTSKHNWPLQRGFDAFYGTMIGARNYFDPITLVEGNTPIASENGEYYYTDAISRRAAEYILAHADGGSDKPFLLYVAYTAPHWPLHALPEDIARYAGRYDAGWDAIREKRRARMTELRIISAQWPLSSRDPRVPAWEDVNAEERAWYTRAMEVYAAQVDRMDQGIGTILAALQTTEQFANTLIMFLADNGASAEVLRPGRTGPTWPSATRTGGPIAIGNDFNRMPGPEENTQSYGPAWANVSNTPFRRYKRWVHERRNCHAAHHALAHALCGRWRANPRGGPRYGRDGYGPGCGRCTLSDRAQWQRHNSTGRAKPTSHSRCGPV